MWNFHRSWFLTLESPRCVTQFCRITRGGKLFFSAILEGKVQTSQMVLLPLSQSHGRFLISSSFTNFGPIFFKANSFLRTKHTAHSNAAKQHISCIINKNKTRRCSFLSLNRALWFIMLVKTYTDSVLQGISPILKY